LIKHNQNFSLAARRLKRPFTVGLVVAGIGLALLHVEEGIGLTHDFIYDIILPPLLFEAAINIHWRELRRDTVLVLALAIFGTLVAAAVVSGGTIAVLGWPTSSAFLSLFKACRCRGSCDAWGWSQLRKEITRKHQTRLPPLIFMSIFAQ